MKPRDSGFWRSSEIIKPYVSGFWNSSENQRLCWASETIQRTRWIHKSSTSGHVLWNFRIPIRGQNTFYDSRTLGHVLFWDCNSYKHFRGDDACMYILSIGALERDLFLCPLMTTLGFALLAWTAPGSLSLLLLFPFCWVFCLMKFLRGFHHLSIPWTDHGINQSMDTLWIAKSLVVTLNLSNSVKLYHLHTLVINMLPTWPILIMWILHFFNSFEYNQFALQHMDLHTFHCVSSHWILWLIHSMCVSSSHAHTCTTSFINVYFPLPPLVHENSHKIILTNTPIKFLFLE